jgi:hypothetical protein
LPQVYPQVFPTYLSWAYSRQLELSSFHNEVVDLCKDFNEPHRDMVRLIELYLLAATLDDVRLRSRVMRSLVIENYFALDALILKRVWGRTPEDSLLRKMIVDLMRLRADPKMFAEYIAYFPENFVRRLAAALLSDVPTEKRE